MNKKNISSQSIKDRLKNIAKQEGKIVQLIYLTYVFERFLFRLSISPYVDKLILKGGLLLYCEGKKFRQTRDIDFYCKGIPNDELKIKQIMEEICMISAPDPIKFFIGSITLTKQMVLDQYHGYKIIIPFEFNSIQDKMHIDLGFSGVIIPGVKKINFPIILEEYTQFLISGYTLETLIAEKLNALYVLGLENTRMKDYYDLYILLESIPFNQLDLFNAIVATFNKRNTKIESNSLLYLLNDNALFDSFKRFCKKMSVTHIPFSKISKRLIQGFLPIFIMFEKNISPELDTIWNVMTFQWV